MLNKKQVQETIKPHLYSRNGLTMIDFQSVRMDFKVPVIFVAVTQAGHIRVKDIVSTKADGIPDKFRNRVAKQRHRDSGYYWWIEDGTGSLIFKPR